ncbi:DUF4381 domain-containing protein [Moritella sp. F3]|uniref:DUF4381 domain-containing protein n=1 Tax=Moritella sp. F3 TaxID=2718882 RepID=UPI001A1B80C6|nr:DUF4381 domain-containing protein [Moritella sp. F3]GIC76220.1 hypothetical protein FMO001_09470 [Moritella sp. F1]GIC82992.1 hypothetical protein FMO003_32720 [Moritella sp. F3]
MMVDVDNANLVGDAFGNLLLRDMVQINIPEQICFLPQTWGWLVVGLVLVLFIGRYLLLAWQKYWRNRYRKKLQSKLLTCDVSDCLHTPRFIHQLLQQACLQAYPKRSLTARQLQGAAFLVFLDSCTQDNTEFDSAIGELWQQALYLPLALSEWSAAHNQVLILSAQRWLKLHIDDAELGSELGTEIGGNEHVRNKRD